MTAAHLENPHAGQGMVLLDIGGDVGALVVTMPSTMVGVEVEIRPEGAETHAHSHVHEHEHDHGHHPHVAVVNRPVAGGEVPSLVFPEVGSGRHELYVKETTEVRLVVDVTGGEVATAVWPS